MVGKKAIAMFLMCMVVVAAVHVHKAEASAEEEYKTCYESCNKDCFQDDKSGNGYTFCEMKCDNECGDEEIKAKLENIIKP